MSANNTTGKVYRSAVLIQISGNQKHDTADALEFRIDLNNRKIEENRAPEFVVKPRRQFVDEGQPAVFKMSFEGSPDSDVSWTVNGEPIVNDSNHKVYEKDGFNFLEIEKVSPSDKGKYECTVENSSGKAKVSADLEVFVKSGPLDKKIQGPTLVQPLKDLSVVEGDRNVVIDCRVSGATRDCSAAWFKDGNEIKHGREFRMKFDSRIASLTISETLEEDNGQYECVISGAFGELRTSCSITVEASTEQREPPVFVRELHDMEVDNGDKVELIVEVRGTEPIHVFWILNNREILPDDVEYEQITEDNVHKLIISRVYEQDTGEYVCEAYNDYGDTDTFCRLQVRDVNIPFAPDFITKPRMITVNEGSDAMFSCQVRGQPTPSIQWEHDGQAVTDGSKYKRSCQGDEHILEIFDVKEEDTGKYMCRLTNSCGMTLHSTSLILKETGSDTTDFRSLLKSRPTLGKTGKQASLSCENAEKDIDQKDFRQLLTRRQSAPPMKTAEELKQHDFRNVLKNMGDKSEKPSLSGLQSMKSKKKTLLQTKKFSSFDSTTKQTDFRNNLKKPGNILNRITSLENITSLEAPMTSNSSVITEKHGRLQNSFEQKNTSATKDTNSFQVATGRKSFEEPGNRLASKLEKFEPVSKQYEEPKPKLFKKVQSSGNIHEKVNFRKDLTSSSRSEGVLSATLPRTKETASLKKRLERFETSSSQKLESKPQYGFSATLPRQSKTSIKDKLNKFELSSSTIKGSSNVQNVSKTFSQNSLAAYVNESKENAKPTSDEDSSNTVNGTRNTYGTDCNLPQKSKVFSKWQPKINWKNEVKRKDRNNEGKVDVTMVEVLPSNIPQKINKPVGKSPNETEILSVNIIPSEPMEPDNFKTSTAMNSSQQKTSNKSINTSMDVDDTEVPENTFTKASVMSSHAEKSPNKTENSSSLSPYEEKHQNHDNSSVNRSPIPPAVPVKNFKKSSVMSLSKQMSSSRIENSSVDIGGIESVVPENNKTAMEEKSSNTPERSFEKYSRKSSVPSPNEEKSPKPLRNFSFNVGGIESVVPENNKTAMEEKSSNTPERSFEKYSRKSSVTSPNEEKSPKPLRNSSFNVGGIESVVPENNKTAMEEKSSNTPERSFEKYSRKSSVTSPNEEKSPKPLRNSSFNVGGIESVVPENNKTSMEEKSSNTPERSFEKYSRKSSVTSPNEEKFPKTPESSFEKYQRKSSIKSPNEEESPKNPKHFNINVGGTESLMPEKHLTKSTIMFGQRLSDKESKTSKSRNLSDKTSSKMTKFAALEVKVPAKAQQVDFRKVLVKQNVAAVIPQPPKTTVIPQPPKTTAIQKLPKSAVIQEPPKSAVIQEPPTSAVIQEPPTSAVIQEPPKAVLIPQLLKAAVISQPPNSAVIQEPPKSEVILQPPKATVVLQPPRVKRNLLDQRVKYGDKAVLESQITGDMVDWSVNGKHVISKLIKMNYTEDNVASLTIAETYSEDEGDYTVTATNKFGSVSSSCHLSVDSSSSLSSRSDIEGPVTTPARITSLAPNNDTVVRGDALEVKVTTTGEPQPDVQWFRGKREIKPDGRIKIENIGDTGILRITEVTSNDAGRYTVMSDNHAGTDQASISIQVEDTPEPPIGKPQITAVVRSSVTLSWCGPAYDGGSQVIHYQVEGRKANEDNWTVYNSSCKSTFFQVDDLEPNTAYVFRVSAGNKHGYSCPGNQSDEIVTENRLQSSSDYESDGTLDVFLPATVSRDDELPFEPREVKISPTLIFEDHYEVLHEVGRGKFANVYQCKAKDDGKIWAAKIVKCREKEKENVRHEIGIMNSLAHPKLLLLWDAFESPRKMVLVMEYIGGGELFERVSSDDFCLTERDCVHFTRQICSGVGYMHNKGVIHLDLKPENILCISEGSNLIKIIDFGLARRFNEGESIKVMFGTPEFIAPEVVNYDEINFATDMWSLGVICYVLLSGLSPFMGDSDSETLSNVTLGEYDFDEESFDDISDNAKDFIQHLLLKNKQKRSTIAECQKHIWLAQDERRIQLKRLNTEKLKRFMARRKWQKTGTAIRALGRMVSLQRLVSGSNLSSSSMDSNSPSSSGSSGSPSFHSPSSMSFISNTFSSPTYKVQEDEEEEKVEPVSKSRECTEKDVENQPSTLSERQVTQKNVENQPVNHWEREIIIDEREITHEEKNVNVCTDQTSQSREVTHRNVEHDPVNPGLTIDNREMEQTHIFKAVPTVNVCRREITLSSNSSLACSEPNKDILESTLQPKNGHINNGFNTDLETSHLRPKFVKKMVDCQAFKGDVVRFDLKVAGNPCPDITWYHEDDIVIQDHRHIVETGGDGQCSLIIRKVCEDDDGEYTAKAVNSCGDASCSADLIICGSGAF